MRTRRSRRSRRSLVLRAGTQFGAWRQCTALIGMQRQCTAVKQHYRYCVRGRDIDVESRSAAARMRLFGLLLCFPQSVISWSLCLQLSVCQAVSAPSPAPPAPPARTLVSGRTT